MSLVVDVRRRLGSFDLEARFESKGRLTTLFGASGSGKTTLVNLIAGLARPDAGRIAAGGVDLVDTASRRWLPAHRRRIGYVFQDARLFPHMTVRQNLGYGRLFTPAKERYADAAAVIDLLGIGHLVDRRPAGLSGGERQRVAIGRALLASPRLLLMDEPLASLDEARKAEILPYIERLRDETGIPIVYVSHSVEEVARLATDVVVLSGGRVSSSGPPGEVLSRLHLLSDEDRDQAGVLVDLDVIGDDGDGLTRLRGASGDWFVPRIEAVPPSRVRVRVRARDVMLATARPEGISALNILSGTVESIEPETGGQAMVALRCGSDRILARVTARSVGALALAPGVAVHAVVKSVTFDRRNPASRTPSSAA
jgi:molybdate transport system ATP-binding protein